MRNFQSKKIFPLLIIFLLFFSGCYFWRGSKIIIERYPEKKDVKSENIPETENKTDSLIDDENEAEDYETVAGDEGKEVKESEYIVGIEDVLSITVWENPDLNREEKVEKDGTISYPFLGRIYVSGKTTKEIDETFTELLGKELVYNPQVSVSVKDYKSNKVFVVGEVGKPGPYYLKESRSLFELLSEAGGVKRESAGDCVLIKRKVSGGNEEYSEIKIPLYKGELEKDFEVLTGDTIKVPEARFFISGEVMRQGFFPINERDLNLYQAIVIAGGFSKAADKYNVRLSRDNGKEVLLVDAERMKKALERGYSGRKEIEEQIEELKIKNGDMIFVPTSFLYSE